MTLTDFVTGQGDDSCDEAPQRKGKHWRREMFPTASDNGQESVRGFGLVCYEKHFEVSQVYYCPTEPAAEPDDAMLAYSVEQIAEWELRRCGTGMVGLGLREQRALLADARATRRMIAELRDELAVLRSAASPVPAEEPDGPAPGVLGVAMGCPGDD